MLSRGGIAPGIGATFPTPPSLLRRGLLSLVVASCAIVAVRTVFPFGGETAARAFSTYLYDGAVFAGASLCYLRAASGRRERLVWLFFGLTLTSWGSGDAYYKLAIQGSGPVTFPSLADLGFMLAYPCSLVALLLLIRSRVKRFPTSLFLDGAIVTLALAALSELIVLPAVRLATGDDVVAVATAIAYPVGDSLLLALALVLVLCGGVRLRLDAALLTIALMTFAVADSLYIYQAATGAYVPGGPIDLSWLVAFSVIAAASCGRQVEAPVRNAPDESWLTTLVPTGLAFAAVGVEIYSHFDPIGRIPLLLVSGVIVLSLVRLVLNFAEHQRLLRSSRKEAVSDPLTGLSNRRALLAHTDALFASAPLQPHVLAIYDLDGFKNYNDTFGHAAGDALLARLGAQLRAVSAGRAEAYRLGGDEFCLLAAAADAEAFQLVVEAGEALTEASGSFDVRPSFGAAFMPDEAVNMTDALRLADRRMYAQKASRPSRVAGTRDALSVALRERDAALADHVDQVGSLASAVASELGLAVAEIECVYTTAMLHDIGKLGIPDGILLKPGPLSDEERRFVETHTVIGERILVAATATAEIARFVRATHERWDGEGYPDGLRGEEIPLPARIVFVCDAYQAMTTGRPYGTRRTAEQALAELNANAGGQFDPTVVAAFAQVASNIARAATIAPS